MPDQVRCTAFDLSSKFPQSKRGVFPKITPRIVFDLERFPQIVIPRWNDIAGAYEAQTGVAQDVNHEGP